MAAELGASSRCSTKLMDEEAQGSELSPAGPSACRPIGVQAVIERQAPATGSSSPEPTKLQPYLEISSGANDEGRWRGGGYRGWREIDSSEVVCVVEPSPLDTSGDQSSRNISGKHCTVRHDDHSEVFWFIVLSNSVVTF
ncbi:predicted protein [Histoplasma capsulatum var. duboisii H88]|uniref:Predicted protein n=1 Tax=Ajellomyces capsulatus (strain H88) TaxID=544711 RepID=F0UE76_AJEC8|nr:predicted protein [Histoplasma capsulatum var. duboisii H88]